MPRHVNVSATDTFPPEDDAALKAFVSDVLKSIRAAHKQGGGESYLIEVSLRSHPVWPMELTAKAEARSANEITPQVQAMVPAGAEAAEAAEEAEEALPTRDEVIALLNGAATRLGGGAAVRAVMQRALGTGKLSDIEPSDYPRLVRAVNEAMQEAA